MMRYKAVFVAVAMAMAFSAFAADPTISVEARQRYPWNGLVDVHFTITGTSGTKYDTSFTAKDMVGNTNIAMKTIRKADGVAAASKEQLLPGTYNWVWDAAADLPKDFQCDRVTVTGIADVSAFPYSVKFNANGGTGTMANESFTYGTAKALTANAFTRTGYTFQGWATSANGLKAYSDEQSVINLATSSGEVVNLYAVWVRSKVQLWSGGPYWAEVNIGAENPWDYGYYFWWGDTVGYKCENNAWMASDGSVSGFSFTQGNTPTYYYETDTLKSMGWFMSDGTLTPAHDAAQVQWGGKWRIPTYADMSDLKNKCDWTWVVTNGVSGNVVCGRGNFASARIFLPAAGRGYETSLVGAGSSGYLWTSTTTGKSSYDLSFTSGTKSISNGSRVGGYSIRPVQNYDE